MKAIDDGINASLVTLELVKYSYTGRVGEKALSSDEVESAHRGLNQIIQAAESIKQNLPSTFIDKEIDDIALRSKPKQHDKSITASPSSSILNGDVNSSINGDGINDPPESKNDLSINECSDKSNHDSSNGNDDCGKSTEDSGESNGKSEHLHRRLSTPGLMPMDAAGEDMKPNIERKRSIMSVFDRNNDKGTVHPQIEDIEAGDSRGLTFSKKSQGNENAALKMTSREAFRIIDVNGDGYLQKDEVVRASEMLSEHGQLDLNGLSPLEFAEKMFHDTDTNGDGQIDIDEFTSMIGKTSSGRGKGLGKANSLAFNLLDMSLLAEKVLIAHQKKLDNNVIGHDMWMIHPLSPVNATWDILISMLILLTVVTMPLTLGWEELHEELYPMNLGVDFIFLVDVCKNFCTGFIVDDDTIIMSAKLVRKNYINGFFLSDFCSSIPLDLILKTAGVDSVEGTITGTKQSLKMLKLLHVVKILRLFRLNFRLDRISLYLKRALMFLEEKLHFRISDGFAKLLRLFVGTMVLGHWIGCFNFLLLRLHNFPSDSWLVYAGLSDKDPLTQWSWSFFKALSQMIMIGFQTPPFTNASCDELSDWCTIEHWVTLGCLYVGAIFYSILISSISTILNSASQSTRLFDERLMQIDEYMRSKKLPNAMREKTKDYFRLKFSDGKLLKEDEILDNLSPVLRREIQQFTGRDICKKIPLLSNPSSKDFAQDISCVIEPMIVFANEIITREGTTGDDMFFIFSGVVEIYAAAFKFSSYLAIGDGCYFGDVSVLLGVRRTASAKTTTQCMLYRLRKDALLSLLRDYPAIEKKMTNVAQCRRRRLAHHLKPDDVALAPGDEIDAEDSKTELFGRDAGQILQDKEKATELDRIHSGIKIKRRSAIGR